MYTREMKQKILVGVLTLGLLGIFGVAGAQVLTQPTIPKKPSATTTTQKATTTTTTTTTTTATSTTPAPVETTVTVGGTTGGAGQTTGTLIIATAPGALALQDVPSTFGDPRATGAEHTDVVVLSSVESTSITIASTTPGVPPTPIHALVVRGKAKPFQFVTLYLFSAPTVVIVQADENGNWQYTFSKDLPDGEHKVYAAVVDNKGAIAAKSQSIGFEKQGAAVTISSGAFLPDLTPASPSILNGPYMMALAILIGLLLAYALVFFGQKYWRPTEVMARSDGGDDDTPYAGGGKPPMAG